MKTYKLLNMSLCPIRFLMQPSNENVVCNVLYYVYKRETYCMSNPESYMVLKYCAQSLAHKPLSKLVQVHLFGD